MHAVSDIKPEARAARVIFTGLPGPVEIVVPPTTLDQAIDCLLLDPAPSSPLAGLVQLRNRTAARLGTSHGVVEVLDVAIGMLRELPAEEITDYPESPVDELVRMKRQFVALFGEKHAHLTGKLDRFQIAHMVATAYIAGCGMNPELYARWQLAQRHLQRKRTALEMIEHLRKLSVEVGAQLARFPDEVGARPLADMVAFQEALDRKQREELKWEAALHDKKLTS